MGHDNRLQPSVNTDSMREAAVAVMLACAAATLAAMILVPRTQIAPAGLVQLLPSGQMASAIQLFSKARQTDSQMGKDVNLELEAESHRAALAKEKLLSDQRRLKAIMQRIRVSSKPRDLHDKLHLVQAQYAVDLKNGYTHQLNGMTLGLYAMLVALLLSALLLSMLVAQLPSALLLLWFSGLNLGRGVLVVAA